MDLGSTGYNYKPLALVLGNRYFLVQRPSSQWQWGLATLSLCSQMWRRRLCLRRQECFTDRLDLRITTNDWNLQMVFQSVWDGSMKPLLQSSPNSKELASCKVVAEALLLVSIPSLANLALWFAASPNREMQGLWGNNPKPVRKPLRKVARSQRAPSVRPLAAKPATQKQRSQASRLSQTHKDHTKDGRPSTRGAAAKTDTHVWLSCQKQNSP